MKDVKKTDRRSFLKNTATAAGAAIVMPQTFFNPVIIPASAFGANDRINVGVIGLGDRGPNHVHDLSFMKNTRVAAICEVRGDALSQRQEEFKANYGMTDVYATDDFREITANPSIDAVVIASPEHWHAYMSVDAMRNGKDVYCEKALSLTVAEGRAMVGATRRYGRILQAGTQQRSDARFRLACELARNGYLGKLEKVIISVPGGHRIVKLEPGKAPANLNYDLWLGPSPYKPYRENLVRYNWYFMTDYCAGWIQSWGVHHLDIGLWGAPEFLQSTLEVQGSAEFEPAGDADVSFFWDVQFKTPSGLTMEFYEDKKSPVGHGCRFVGSKGWVHVTRAAIAASDPALLETVFKPNDERLYVSENHMKNFIDCIGSRREPVAPVEACHAATTLSLVADIATRVKRKMKWDWNKEQFIGDDFANRLLSRTMRSPWQV
jgi:predicted dehydrogenase